MQRPRMKGTQGHFLSCGFGRVLSENGEWDTSSSSVRGADQIRKLNRQEGGELTQAKRPTSKYCFSRQGKKETRVKGRRR